MKRFKEFASHSLVIANLRKRRIFTSSASFHNLDSVPIPDRKGATEKKLFTPGPLCVTATVKAALARDMGSRDTEFIKIVKDLRTTLVDIASKKLIRITIDLELRTMKAMVKFEGICLDLPKDEYTAVLMQGSGTFAVESVLQSASDRSQKVLVVANGAYGKRMKTILDKAGIPNEMLEFPETQPIQVENTINALESGKPDEFSAVAVVHCETTSGVVNPIEKLGKLLKRKYMNIKYIVDAMSSFGGIETDYSTADFVISSANKCLQGVPAFAFVIARIDALQECKDNSTSLSLDLYEQWRGLELNGQFRFTPPTHAILGLRQACIELENEGGVAGRAKRYAENAKRIKRGMAERGFKQLVDNQYAGYIITSFHYPVHENFKFEEFYERLSDMGQLIYPGKVTNADCFRIGHIGDLDGRDMDFLLCCIDRVLHDMGIFVPLKC